MLSERLSQFFDLMHKGGPLMWVLLGMSVLSVALMVERTWFWINLNSPSQIVRLVHMEQMLRRGDRVGARQAAESHPSVYSRIVLTLLDEDYSDALATSIVESQRPRLERAMGVLSTMITAAPLIGLLGTVSGLISSFRLLSEQTASTDPRWVGLGLSEALLNTAAGLVVTVITIFPYNAFRVQIDRTLSRIESLLSSGAHLKSMPKPPLAGKSGETPPTPAREEARGL